MPSSRTTAAFGPARREVPQRFDARPIAAAPRWWIPDPRRAGGWGLLVALVVVLLTPATAFAQEPDMFTKALERGPVFAGAAAFVGGLLVSLTPCVYPMIAITVSVFGAREAKNRGEAMLLSTAFVAGIVVLFTALLVGAALSGRVFGSFLSDWRVVVAISIVFFAMALSMFGAFEMVLPDSLMQRLSGVGGVGFGGAFLLGLVSALVAAPCTGPVLTGILLWIGKTQNAGLGAIVGATFALGLGVPFWLVGTFAVALPKAGKWMVAVKSFFGIVLIVVALHFLKAPFPALAAVALPETAFKLAFAGLVLVGLILGAVHLSWEDGGLPVKIRKGLGIAAPVVGAFLLVASFDSTSTAAHAGGPVDGPVLAWEHDEKLAVDKATQEKRPLIVDFTADWCAACKETTRETFNNPEVMKKTARFVAVKIDATNDDDPQVEAVKGKYKVVGLPTIVLFDSSGKEQKRFNQFVGPEEFLKATEAIQ